MSLNILIGRKKECRLISDLINRRKDIIVFGEEGVGKTAIIRKLLAERRTETLLYSEQSKTLKEALLSLIAFSAGPKKLMQKKSILALKKMCYGILDKNPGYVVFDHITWIEPRFYGFLTYIRDKDLPLMIVSRGVNKKNIGQLWRSSYTFEKVEITNLDKAKAEEVISHYIAGLCLKLAHGNDFKREVFNISKGNPKIIKQLCFLARDEKYHAKGYADVKLMDLDRRISEATI